MPVVSVPTDKIKADCRLHMIANSCSREHVLYPEQMRSTKNPSHILLDTPGMCHWLLIGNSIAGAQPLYQICTIPPPRPYSNRISPSYFVLMCFSLPGEYRKLLA